MLRIYRVFGSFAKNFIHNAKNVINIAFVVISLTGTPQTRASSASKQMLVDKYPKTSHLTTYNSPRTTNFAIYV
jgi:hypothetical protein